MSLSFCPMMLSRLVEDPDSIGTLIETLDMVGEERSDEESQCSVETLRQTQQTKQIRYPT